MGRSKPTYEELEIRLERATEMFENTGKMARIGSWEVDLINDKIYWSATTKEIHEVASDYEPQLDKAIHFYKEGPSRETIILSYKREINSKIGYELFNIKFSIIKG